MEIPVLLAIVAGLWVALVLAGGLEALKHRWLVSRIPVRVHVNGTRGKTSVTRLIAAGLRAGGKRVCAKTTGSAAAVTDPDGREFPIYRISGANIIEQMRTLKRMARLKPEIVVMECMALQPQYQSLSELRMVRSNVGVITNARPDHLDVMGPGEEDVALALAGSTPVKGNLFTAERDLLPTFEHSCKDRKSELHGVTLEEVEAISDDTMSQFRYAEHKENVALALKICEHLGVDRDKALKGMTELEPEAGAMQVLHINYFKREIVFVNGFAANDPESTGKIWENMIEKFGEGRKKIMLINCRADRPHRSQQMAEEAGKWTAADKVILMGSGCFVFVRNAVKYGLDPEKLLVLEGGETTDITETILEESAGNALVVGMCNIHGGGEEVARFFQNRAVKEEDL
ncbi:poly-gamma-glutamate synthase PgsB [Idiomarina sp. WRN-38]|uniref:poly-gamma-glutamate synthase PgsB n=1 Tax=Idiomarina sp. OXR-189 TaxID=3100175 RepID=UPI000733990E|nr:poly-gamma-glutamate synthase PgsB [Idiomarina sp. OXR-189]KTG24560.1 poly-gamma-glutamate synthase PgsB [Idiomarina sp. H105]OAE93066.1 poly-gamma-glutamate synthase PgsB [Idiomarina sp. WRN-38]WPZ01128.1 poly-gamma-glutamate synthase PgsB [Idiomarina sp. OXR-189]